MSQTPLTNLTSQSRVKILRSCDVKDDQPAAVLDLTRTLPRKRSLLCGPRVPILNVLLLSSQYLHPRQLKEIVMSYRYSTTVGTERNQPLTSWQTPAAALCQNKPKVRNVYAGVIILLAGVIIYNISFYKVLLAPTGKVRATEGWREERQNCDVYFLGCGVSTITYWIIIFTCFHLLAGVHTKRRRPL